MGLISSLFQERNDSFLMVNVSGNARCQSANQPAVTIEDYKHCFQKKERIQRWISATEKYTSRESDQFYVA